MLPRNQPEKPNWGKIFPEINLSKAFARNRALSHTPLNTEAANVQLATTPERLNGVITNAARKYPKLSLVFAGLGGLSIILAIQKGAQTSSAKSEIEFRKTQLNQPTYELKGNEAVHVPWNKENLKNWLHRPVKITGRPIHNKAMLVPRTVEGYSGYDYIVPLVTNENEDGSVQEGVLLNKGWIPHEYYHIGARWKIENSLPQTFEGYVSVNSELDEKNEFFKKGNATGKRFNKWSHVYLPDMAEASGFKNASEAKVALIECVSNKSVLDERLPKHYEMTLIGSEDYPYPKTRAGALQLRHMPWDLRSEQNFYLAAGFVFTGLAGALRFLV
jgi:cytochrome oxidase assembly protein ShyY1